MEREGEGLRRKQGTQSFLIFAPCRDAVSGCEWVKFKWNPDRRSF